MEVRTFCSYDMVHQKRSSVLLQAIREGAYTKEIKIICLIERQIVLAGNKCKVEI